MSAVVTSALYAWCESCADGSEVGISRQEAEHWAEQHDADNHMEEN